MPSFDKVLTFLLPIISTLVVVLAIIYDGKLVEDNTKPILRKIKPAGYILILFTLFLNLYQSVSSENTLTETKTLARIKEIKDSISIANLTQLAKENLIKADENTTIADANLRKTEGIKIQLIDNTIKEFEEQRLAIERERENIFIHFQNEIRSNIINILINFDDNNIKSFDNTDKSINCELKKEYIKKYLTQSNNEIIITYLTNLIDKIEQINMTIQFIFYSTPDHRTHNVNALIEGKNEIYKDLYSVLCRMHYLKSYKEYEAINFNKPVHLIDTKTFLALYNYEFTPASKMLIENTFNEKMLEQNKKGAAN